MSIKYQISVRVRNATWYEAAKEYKTTEEWEIMNNDKISKHYEEVDFTFLHPINNIVLSNDTKHSFQLLSKEGKSLGNKELDELVIHFFEHDDDKSFVIISNSILHSFYIQKQHGKTYVYFYIKEDVEYDEVTPYIWLSKEHRDILSGDNGGFGIVVQEVTQSSRLGHISVERP